jgi:hypothetical protein
MNRMSIPILIPALALSVLLAAGCAAPASAPAIPPATPSASPTPAADLNAPAESPPVIDGTLSPGEWDGARVETLSDGSELLLLTGEGDLYLAVRGNTPEMIAGNVFLDRGGEIAILHSSAALGTAIYAQQGESWTRTQDFEWRCRATDDGPAAVHERQGFFATERWLAANARRGTPNELEYRIEADSPDLRLAVNLVRSSDPQAKPVWPVDLDDDTILPTPGGFPMQMHFDPERWMVVHLLSFKG